MLCGAYLFEVNSPTSFGEIFGPDARYVGAVIRHLLSRKNKLVVHDLLCTKIKGSK